jgi:peptide/nickel transport system substrate-binding protein
MYYWASGEWLPLLATEWSFIQAGGGSASPAASPATDASASPAAGGINPNADTFEIKLREGAMWSDDTPITAQDLVDTLWLRRLMLQTEWKYLDDVVAVDDYTVHCHMSFPSTEVERYVIRNAYPRPSSVYGEWAQRARELFQGGLTTDDPEGAQLLDQFTQFRPESAGPVSGPFMIDEASITNAQLTLVRNDKAWNADQVLFDRIINYNGETDTISAVVLSGDVDYATHGFSVATENQMAENGIRVVRPPTYAGAGLFMNFGRHAELQDVRVRRAFAHAIDRAQTGTIALGESGVGVQYMTGMSDNKVPQWMSEDAISGLNQYEYDQEAAAALLEEAGWTKDGDFWLKPDGEQAVYELSFPAEFADYSATGQDVSEQLTAFGIQIEPRAITHAQHPIDVNQGNFSLAIRTWGSSNNPHPHYDFAQALFFHNTQAQRDGGEGMAFPLVQETEVAGEVDLDQLTVEAAEGLDLNAQKENVTIVAQVFNELLPVVPLLP